MKELFSRTVFSYILGLLAIVVLTGIILSYAVENAIMLVFILFFQMLSLWSCFITCLINMSNPSAKLSIQSMNCCKEITGHEFATQSMAVSVNSIKRSIA